jgi:hypothetical protein
MLRHKLWSQRHVTEGSIAVQQLVARDMQMAVEELLGAVFSNWFASKLHVDGQ